MIIKSNLIPANYSNLINKLDQFKSLGVESMQDMGRVMGAVMKELDGNADGKIVQQIVQNELK